MISFGVYEKDIKTNKEQFLDSINAENIAVARKLFIKEHDWKPRKNIKLVLKSPVGI